MTTKKYRFDASEIDGVEQQFPTEVDFPSSEMLLSIGGLIAKPEFKVTSAGTHTLTATSNCAQVFSGTTAGQIVKLPDATTLQKGWKYEIYNLSTQTLEVRNGANGLVETLLANSNDYLFLSDNSTPAGVWVQWQATIGTAIGLLNYNMTSDTPFTTSERVNDVAITGMSFTPVTGKYACWYNASVYYTTTPKAHYWSLYRGGVQLANSLRRQDTAHSNQTMVDSTQTIADFNGSQTVDVRVKCDNTGTLTVNSRSLVLVRVGPVG